MTPDEFSNLAVRLGPDIQAKTILETVQFRLGERTLATVGWPERGWAVVKIEPGRQAWALGLSDGVAREPGRRRNSGILLLRLAAIDAAVAVELLTAAWRHAHGARRARGQSRATAHGPARLAV